MVRDTAEAPDLKGRATLSAGNGVQTAEELCPRRVVACAEAQAATPVRRRLRWAHEPV